MSGDFYARVLLQDWETLLYLVGPGEWTPDVDLALDFQHVRQAHEFALKTRQFNLDIVMTFGEPCYDVRLRATMEQSSLKLKPES